jgi:hypothetical protein
MREIGAGISSETTRSLEFKGIKTASCVPEKGHDSVY